MTSEIRTLKWVQAASLEDLWEGEMTEVEVEGEAVLLLNLPGRKVVAYQGICPHQQRSLEDGEFDGQVITCAAHRWQFEAATGKGINPANCQLYTYEVRVEGEEIFIGVPEDSGRRYNRCTA